MVFDLQTKPFPVTLFAEQVGKHELHNSSIGVIRLTNTFPGSKVFGVTDIACCFYLFRLSYF